ncbi:MAG: amylo-alpha-1,6-glucosidase [Chromatiaceae bacterium]
MPHAIRVDDRWYIPATSSRADDRTRVLKSADGFAVFSRHGEMSRVGLGEQGLYHLGTRHLSEWRLLVEGHEPMLLNSTVRRDNSRLAVDQTTPDLNSGGRTRIPKGTVHLKRELAAHDCALTERLTVVNYHDSALSIGLEYHFAADFRDIFEVRGQARERRGEIHAPEVSADGVILTYAGLDAVVRRTRIAFDPAPASLGPEAARFAVDLLPGATWTLEISVACASGGAHFCIADHGRALAAVESEVAFDRASRVEIFTDNEQLNDWINRSAADLQLLITETRHGLYPYAGVPWFSTPFGRDGLITALQTLWSQPSIAAGVLQFLAATQADHEDPEVDAEPGKVIHELREGEMAALGEVPFRRYYGSVDATPLFAMLAGRYQRRTGDTGLIERLWPNLERALRWIDERLARDGFLVYRRQGARGLLHQGWKDSSDAIFHRDGRPAEPPIALCEVQGYAEEALRRGADLAERLGHSAHRDAWRARAASLRQRLEANLWVEEIGSFALALDGRGRPCAIRTSNPAHLLFTGSIALERARRLAAQLASPAACNGWGLRTVFAGEPRYNPMSYHNGSVWPHDTALAAAGLAQYGFADAALRLIEGLFNASIHFDLHRLPELFCGFDRQVGQAPTNYPVACSPQAWASGAVFMLVQAMLGLDFEPDEPRVKLRRPRLPDYVSWLRVRGLCHGEGQLDFSVHRSGDGTAVRVERRVGDLELIVTL